MASPCLRTAPAVAALLVTLASAAPARAADPVVTWDKDLAFDWDRTAYEKRLRELVRTGEAEVSAWLGLTRTRPLAVNVITPARYQARFGGGAPWIQGAHYRAGEIWVDGGSRQDATYEGLVIHELAHAVLDDRGTADALPTWFVEGLAERLRYRRLGQQGLSGTQVSMLEDMLDHGFLLPLLRSGRPTQHGYLQGFAAVLYLEQKLGRDGFQRLVRRALEVGSLEKALDLEQRWTTKEVEAGFRYWVDHLQ